MKAKLFSAFPYRNDGVLRSWFLVTDDGVEIRTDSKDQALEIAAKLELELAEAVSAAQ